MKFLSATSNFRVGQPHSPCALEKQIIKKQKKKRKKGPVSKLVLAIAHTIPTTDFFCRNDKKKYEIDKEILDRLSIRQKTSGDVLSTLTKKSEIDKKI